jgi:hypothetical protein
MPDRLPSLIVLVGFWVPPAVAGWYAAGWLQERALQRRAVRNRSLVTQAALPAFVVAYAVAWFFFNLGRMPPYIPGAVMDPTIATPQAIKGLAVFASMLILPGSAIACALAFRQRARTLRST